jgi:hypothetical protein
MRRIAGVAITRVTASSDWKPFDVTQIFQRAERVVGKTNQRDVRVFGRGGDIAMVKVLLEV